MDKFLGEHFSYWVELQKRVNELSVNHLLRDLADLSAKVNYYETQIDRMASFRDSIEKKGD